MKKAALIDEINAFAAARGSGNPLLMQRQAEVVDAIMRRLPEDLPETPAEAVPTQNNANG